MQFKKMRVLVYVGLILSGTGCLADDPASFRTVDTLLSGHWIQVAPSPAGPPTVDFQVDRSFTATSSGVPGVRVAGYHGSFWQAGDILGLRGIGAIEGIHVQFVVFRIQASPELRLTLTEIIDEFVAETIGVEDIASLDGNGMQSALRRLDGLTFSEDVLGDSWDYLQ